MNIMEICSGTLVNGAIVHCLLLSRELARRGHRVILVCHPQSWIRRQLAGEPVEVVCSDLRRWPPDELQRIAGILHDRRIDVIHTHMSRAHFFGVLLRFLTGVPCVAAAQHQHIQLHWMFNNYVIACSDATRRYHRWHNLVRPAQIETIRNFIDYRRMAEVTDDARASLRASLALDDDSLLIGVVGDVVPRKGLVHLVGALPKILRAVPEAWLLVSGARHKAPHYVAGIGALAERLGVASRIIWLGHREDVDQIMAAMDVCVLPSLAEPLGMVTLEAMAAGRPVVGSRVGGIPECIVDGETGILVPPADSHALAEAVISLLQDPARRRTLGEAGRKRVQERFSPEVQTRCVEAVFSRVTQRRKAA